MYGQENHRLFQCMGCDKVFYQVDAWNSEDWDTRFDPATGQEEVYCPSTATVYPEPEQENKRPTWYSGLHKTDWPLFAIMGETYAAAEGRSFILASVGLRTALDRAMQILGIDPGHTLEEKLAFLKLQGFVGETEHDILSVVANAGSAAAHRGWAPQRVEFDDLLLALEQFIQRTIVIGQKALEIKNNIPARHPRPARAKPTDKPALTREAGYEVAASEAGGAKASLESE